MQNTIITLCGSGRYRDLIHGISDALKEEGYIVLPPPLHDLPGLTAESNEEGKLLAWKGATFAHLNRIQKADVCLMVNPDSYLGYSSTLELGYAASLGKLIVALEHDINERAREGLFDIVLETTDRARIVEKIIKLLKA